jgi:hypothetical protein
VTVEKSTNQMQAFHEPPSRRPHCSSTQQWVTPELGLSSTPGQGIQTQAEVTGNSVTHNHQEECSPRNLPRSLPTDPHSPHACSTPGECTFSVTWTVLRLPVSLTLGYRNRPDRKSPGSVAATGFLPRALSFLCALSHLEGVAHRPTSLTQSRTACHNKHRENGHRLPKNRFSSHRMFSRSRFQNRAPRTSSLSFSWANRDSSPKLTWTFRSGNAHTSFLSQTDSTALNKGKHAFFSTQHRLPLCNRHTRGLLQTGSYGSCSGQSGRMECLRSSSFFFPHGCSFLFYLHASGWTFVTLGTACVPSACLPVHAFPFC